MYRQAIADRFIPKADNSIITAENYAILLISGYNYSVTVLAMLHLVVQYCRG